MKFICSLAVALAAGSTAMAQSLNLGGTPGSAPVPIQITASGGINWSQKTDTVTATGNAKAVRGSVTVTADELIAHYMPKKTGTASAADNQAGPLDQGNAQLTELDAVGNVHIYTATDNAWGDHAVYTASQQVLVLTGKNLKLTSPQDVVTARDSIEYYAAEHKAIARGDARITTSDGRTVTADVIIGYFSSQPANGSAGQSDNSPSGNLEKVDALGNVVITTKSDQATGNSGVYLPNTGTARLGGNVQVTHEGNKLAGSDALVNMKTGTATLLSTPSERVSGVILPGSGKN